MKKSLGFWVGNIGSQLLQIWDQKFIYSIIQVFMMNQIKPALNKSQLLSWANSSIKSWGHQFQKIESFGNGVGYLYIIERYFPGTVNPSKIIQKAQTQYQCLQNLKLLGACLNRLNCNHPFDIMRICQMKFQDNLVMLQWLNNLVQNFKINKSSMDSLPKQPRSKKINIITDRRIPHPQDKKLKKVDSEHNHFSPKKIASSTKNINDISSILNNKNYTDDEIKLEKIKQILFGKGSSPPTNHNIPIMEAQKIQTEKEQMMEEEIKDIEEDKVIENPYLKYTIRESILKKTGLSMKSMEKQESKVKIGENSEVFQYNNEERLTENSDLLKSEGRKSMENLLNNPDSIQ